MLKHIVVLLACAAAVSAAQAETRQAVLGNGMKILVKEDRRAPVAAVRLWYRVGSVDEEAGKTGLSHALEHMMFKGTPSVPSGEYSRRVAALGGDNNAYTTRTDTVYTADLAVKNLREVLQMEADRMVNLNFSDRDFENEMKVIREERRWRVEDNPFGKLNEAAMRRLWHKPYNQVSVIGGMADLHALSAEDLRAWYRKWYAPNNAMLVIVGDVDAAQTVRTAAEIFGKIPARTLPERRNDYEAVQAAEAGTGVVYSVTAQPVLSLHWRVPKMQSVQDDAGYALSMLGMVLSGTDSARYERKLVRGDSLALGVSAGGSGYGRKNALFAVTAMPNGGVSVEQLKTRLLAEIRDIADKGVSREELALIRGPLESGKILAKDSVRTQADLLGEDEQNGFGHQYEETMLRRLLAVTPQQVKQAARMLLARPCSETVLLPNLSGETAHETQ
ncbi:pitrilysin family protein [Neisseria leonii]|uniref:M16 family metallopeptidase n=1 Tax=Neisseria leonii TaxID=2995413 RepID=UPI0030CCB398